MSSVSVVIPCYNYGHVLPDCVESVLAQRGVDVRVLIIDDCSTDDSFDVAKRLADEDPRVEARRHEQNRGHIATYNEGLLGWADGDYTALISADDMVTPGSFERAAALMDAHPSVGFVYGRSVYFETTDALPEPRTVATDWIVWKGEDWLEVRCRNGHNVISSPEVMVRTSVQHQAGGYRPELPNSGDLEMWMRLSSLADVGYLAGVDQAYYRIHPTSMQRSGFMAPLTVLNEHVLAFGMVFADYQKDPQRAAYLKNLLYRAVAREALWRAARSYDSGRVAESPVEELRALALTCYGAAARLPEYRALRRRQALGETLCHSSQLFAPSAAVRRIQNRLWWRMLAKNGVGTVRSGGRRVRAPRL